MQGIDGQMESLAKLLIAFGVFVAIVGGLLWAGAHFKWFRFGRLPGDFSIERNGFGVYFPLASMLILSAVLTLILWIVGKLRS